MTRPKHIPAKPNGRPFSGASDRAEKICIRCGRVFRLRERPQSLARFQTRKFCSQTCANPAKQGASGFWETLNKMPNGCWEWPGRRYPKGYGKIERDGKDVRAHRYAYVLAKGPIPAGAMILHSCDNPPCCNPDHLRPGTAKENREDAISRGRISGGIVADKRDPRIFAGTLKHAASVLGVSQTTIGRLRAARPTTRPV